MVPPPTPTLSLASFGSPSIDGGVVSFTATDSNGGSNLLFVRFDPATGAIVVRTYAAWTGSLAPGAATFTTIGNPSLSDFDAAFRASTTQGTGLFVVATSPITGAVLFDSRIVAIGDAAPSATTFTELGSPSLSANTVAFAAGTSDGSSGVYEMTFDNNTGLPSAITRLVRLGDAAPGGGTFTFLGDPVIDGGGVAYFYGTTSDGRTGIFSASSSGGSTQLHTLVDTNTPIPGGSGTFALFGDFSVSGGALAFAGAGLLGTQAGIFHLAPDLTLSSVIDVGDLLFGKSIVDLAFGNDGLDAGSLAFVAQFGDRSFAVVRTDVIAGVPEPAIIWLLALALLGALLARERHGRVNTPLILDTLRRAR
jgi:hypothetical protein